MIDTIQLKIRYFELRGLEVLHPLELKEQELLKSFLTLEEEISKERESICSHCSKKRRLKCDSDNCPETWPVVPLVRAANSILEFHADYRKHIGSEEEPFFLSRE